MIVVVRGALDEVAQEERDGLVDPAAAAKPQVMIVNIRPRRSERRYGEIMSGASLWPRNTTVPAIIDSTLLTPSRRDSAPPR